jgi:hypothetical protein
MARDDNFRAAPGRSIQLTPPAGQVSASDAVPAVSSGLYSPFAKPDSERQPGGIAPTLQHRAIPHARLTASGWALWRPDAGAASLSDGQLGGSQAGMRIAYPIASLGAGGQLKINARVSAPLGRRLGKEGAFGVALLRPLSVPVELIVERRVALDNGGRNAFAAIAAGGVDALQVAGPWTLNGYLQAGVVGARKRDAFADGGASLRRPVGRAAGMPFDVGIGVWGAAQPGLRRLDVGPEAALRLHGSPVPLRVAAQWRFRMAGNARPASGPAIVVSSDF